MRSRPQEPCPEADMLTGYYERALSPGEAREMDEHLERCMRCRGELRAMARAIGPISPVRAPRRKSYWLWLVPGATVVVAAAVWFTVGPAPSGFNARARQGVGRAPSTVQGTSQREGNPAGALFAGDARQQQGGPAPASSAQVPEPPEEKRIVQPPMAVAQPDAAAGNTAAEKQSAKNASAPGSEAGPSVAAGNPANGLQPTSLPPEWRFGPAGSIERSDDGGVTWRFQPTGVTSDLLAGVAASDRICWMVGREGTVLRTTDGQHWLLVEAPTSRDLIGVTAKDEHSVRVTADDGSEYETVDGGQSWQKSK